MRERGREREGKRGRRRKRTSILSVCGQQILQLIMDSLQWKYYNIYIYIKPLKNVKMFCKSKTEWKYTWIHWSLNRNVTPTLFKQIPLFLMYSLIRVTRELNRLVLMCRKHDTKQRQPYRQSLLFECTGRYIMKLKSQRVKSNKQTNEWTSNIRAACTLSYRK